MYNRIPLHKHKELRLIWLFKQKTMQIILRISNKTMEQIETRIKIENEGMEIALKK